MIYLAFAAFIISFVILFKCADFFVDGACGIADLMKAPKIFVGVVLVGLATTAPEFVVSVAAAFKHHPEIALGNAIGSVICDDGIALGLAAIIAPTVIMVNCRFIKAIGIFLLAVDFFAYFLARNGTLGRLEGAALVLVLVVYFILLFKNKYFRYNSDHCAVPAPVQCKDPVNRHHLKKPLLLFLAGLVGVIISGNVIVEAAVYIARHFRLSEIIIGSTVIALGTSLPEISTCITAARKGEGELAVGNIIGADVLNILWIIGVSAIVRPIQVDLNVINFAFPFMILIVTVMLAGMRWGCRLGKPKGVVLIVLYFIYIILTLKLFT